MDTNDASGATVFRLPRSHWHCALWNFDWETVHPASLHDRVLAFLHGVQDKKAPHLILTGPPGIGKTHVGIGAYRVGSVTWGTELVTWLNMPAFCERVKRAYGDASADPWYDLESAKRLVVVDDMFGKALSPHETDQILVRLLDTCYQNGAAMLITMNPSVEEIQKRLNPHEISRMLADSTIIPMQADTDRRR